MSNYEQQQQGALERLGIPVETMPPDGVMTSGQAQSVRFRISRPQGYAFGDVESFLFDHIQPTLEWYANALHQRDLAVHKLGEIIDKLEVDLLNLNAQLDNKQYNEALGLAVEDSEKDDETEFLLVRIKELEQALSVAQQQQYATTDAPIQAPDGEFYSREEVEGFIATAVAEAEARKDAEIAEAGYYTQQQVESILAEATQSNAIYTQEQTDALIAEAVANLPASQAPEGEFYSREEVEGFIATAVAEAEAQKQTELENALAEAAANQPAPVVQNTGYTEEELETAVAEAVKAKEEEVLASFPADAKPKDQIEQLTDEGDLKLRAEVKTLRAALAQMDSYTKELEAYIAQIEGDANSPSPIVPAAETSTGRPLPKIRPEDL